MNNLSEYSKLADGLFDFNISGFEEKALQVFSVQSHYNPIYRQFVDHMGIKPASVARLEDIPFLPIAFFKTHDVVTGDVEAETWFESSGTTGSVNSRHLVKDLHIYRTSFLEGFSKFYGDPAAWCIIGLLPSYLERQHSSLVMMVDELVKRSGRKESGFYLYDHEALVDTLRQLEARQQKTLLIGVTFALLDLADKFPFALHHTVVMETGGMKGRREEMTRQQVHEQLKKGFGVSEIHSEYGMTELLSQGYSAGNGIFHCTDTMKIMIREEDDPLAVHSASEKMLSGIINVIDLANIHSCSFIATEDAGKLYPDGSFEVTGRVDHSDIRGCSLMVV